MRLPFWCIFLGIAISPSGLAQAESPVRLSTSTQLVVDDMLLASKQGVARHTHACTKLPKPVIQAERPWEGQRTYIYGSVLYDPDARQFRMWYMGRKGEKATVDPRLTCSKSDFVLYAVSSDGIAWTRPSLRLYEYNGSNDNNIVFAMHTPSILLDPKDPDPARRYKMMGHGKGSVAGYCAATSPDGLHWEALRDNPVLPFGDTLTLCYDSARGEYLAFHKRPGKHRGFSRRMVYLSTSRDFRTWSEAQLVLAPDEKDDEWAKDPGQRTEFYNLSVFESGGQFLGLATVFKHRSRNPKPAKDQSPDDGPIDVQLVHSRDGRQWSRLEDRNPVIPNGPYGYDAGCILGVCNTPVMYQGEMWVYYTAITTTHGGALPEKQISIARATWPKDRFVSLDAQAEGCVETVPLKPVGNRLRVNADASAGSLAVEVVGEDGQAIPGFSAADCLPVGADALDQSVRWKDRQTLPTDRAIRLRFRLQRAKLYAFTIAS